MEPENTYLYKFETRLNTQWLYSNNKADIEKYIEENSKFAVSVELVATTGENLIIYFNGVDYSILSEIKNGKYLIHDVLIRTDQEIANSNHTDNKDILIGL